MANLLKVLKPDLEFDFVPYASNIVFELYKKGQSYTVRTFYNGRPLVFDSCMIYENCELSRWISHIQEYFYTSASKIKELCFKTPTDADYFEQSLPTQITTFIQNMFL